MTVIFKRKINATEEQKELLSNIVNHIYKADRTHAVQDICLSNLSYNDSGLFEVTLLDSNLYISVIVNHLEDVTDAMEDVIYKYNHEHQNIQHVVIDIACDDDDNTDAISIWNITE